MNNSQFFVFISNWRKLPGDYIYNYKRNWRVCTYGEGGMDQVVDFMA